MPCLLAIGCGAGDVEPDISPHVCSDADGDVGSAVGQTFPDVQLVGCDGARSQLKTWRCEHELTVVSVGAGWCQPCKEETPHLQAAYEQLVDDDIGVLQVLFQDAKGNPATTVFCEAWVDSFQLTLPVLMDPPGNTLDSFDSAATPLNVIVDRRGRVVWSQTGKVVTDLVPTVRSLLGSSQ